MDSSFFFQLHSHSTFSPPPKAWNNLDFFFFMSYLTNAINKSSGSAWRICARWDLSVSAVVSVTPLGLLQVPPTQSPVSVLTPFWPSLHSADRASLENMNLTKSLLCNSLTAEAGAHTEVYEGLWELRTMPRSSFTYDHVQPLFTALLCVH